MIDELIDRNYTQIDDDGQLLSYIDCGFSNQKLHGTAPVEFHLELSKHAQDLKMNITPVLIIVIKATVWTKF